MHNSSYQVSQNVNLASGSRGRDKEGRVTCASSALHVVVFEFNRTTRKRPREQGSKDGGRSLNWWIQELQDNSESNSESRRRKRSWGCTNSHVNKNVLDCRHCRYPKGIFLGCQLGKKLPHRTGRTKNNKCHANGSIDMSMIYLHA